MTENEAIKEIMHGVCNYKGISKFCHDKCMVEKEKCEFSMAIKALEEIQQYRAIGTVEECREARGKQKAIKPVFEINYGDYESRFACACGKRVVVRHNRGVMDNNDAPNYCLNCGQKLDWAE